MHAAFLVLVPALRLVPETFVQGWSVRAEPRSISVRTGVPSMEGSLMGFHEREPEAFVQGGGNPAYRVRSAAERRQMRDPAGIDQVMPIEASSPPENAAGAPSAAIAACAVQGGGYPGWSVSAAAERQQLRDVTRDEEQEVAKQAWLAVLAEQDSSGTIHAATSSTAPTTRAPPSPLPETFVQDTPPFFERDPESFVQGGGDPAYAVRSAAERRQLSDQQQQHSYGTTHSTASTTPTTRAPPSPLPEGGHDTWMMHEAGERRSSRGQGFPAGVSPRATPLQVRYGVSSTEAILEYGDGNSCE